MIDLIEIRDYLHKTTKVISSVLGMNVLMCDNDFSMLGDSNLETMEDVETEKLSHNSVLTLAIYKKKTVILRDVKLDNPGCKVCPKEKECTVVSIIAHPIWCRKKIIGAIGIYARDREQQQRLIENQASYILFIENMCQMILGKLEDEETRIHLLISSRKMKEVIEATNFPFININEKNEILHYNQLFEDLFLDKLKGLKIKDARIPIDGMENPNIMRFIENTKSAKEETFTLKTTNGVEDYDVTFSPVIIENTYRGGLLYFRKTKEFFDKVSSLLYKSNSEGFEAIVGNSEEIQKVKEEAEIFAQSTSTIFIQGESGTGKEVFARAIHAKSKARKGPFIAINCAAIPDNLMESELFGYEEGSFTGAMKGGRIGKFELANHGTLFLDEIGELPIHLQSKLLRVLQERKIQRIGGTRDIPIEIRIITATNRDLEAMMKSGEFREDLYYRLNVIPLAIPPLRERKSDIPVLVNYFVEMYSQMLEKNILGVSTEAMDALKKFAWTGNVRELQNAVEYAVNRCNTDYIALDDIKSNIYMQEDNVKIMEPIPLATLEKQAIENALLYYGNTLEGKEKVAKALGISRATLYRKLNPEGK